MKTQTLFRRCAIPAGWIALTLAGYSAPYPTEGRRIDWHQPDGTVVHLKVIGDEFYARTVTEDGYTVLLDEASQSYVYARKDVDTGAVVPTPVPVTLPPPVDITPGVEEPPVVIQSKRAAMVERYDSEREAKWDLRVRAVRAQRAKQAGRALVDGDAAALAPFSAAEQDAMAAPVTGAKIGLVILAQFPDDPQTGTNDPVSFPTTQTKINRYCNEVGYTDDGNTGSIRDYYADQSLGQLTFTQSVTQVITLPHPRDYYNYSSYPNKTTLWDSGQAGRLLVADAIAVLKSSGFNFSNLTVNGSNQVVSTSLMFAGNDSGVWAYGLWPHAWSLSGSGINVGTTGSPRYIYRYQCTNVATSAAVIGTMCHELGHLLLGYPDLYDTYAGNGDSEGVGNHSLMGAANHLNGGRTPGPIDLYLKDVSGWASITDITTSQNLDVTLPSTGNVGYRIRRSGSTTEYFLFENRGSGDKWAASSPDKGVLIWHVDESVTTGNQNQQMTPSQHYLISVEQADGQFDLENNRNRGDANDLFDSSRATFNDSSTPDARWWSGTGSGITANVLSPPGASMNVRFGSGGSRPAITSALSATTPVGVSFSYQITASSSPTSFGATGLPTGLSVNSGTGLISGTPSAAGNYSITISATNGFGAGSATLSLSVVTPVTAFSDDFDPNYDGALWSAFGSTVAANTNGQAAGVGSTGNSLWFGGDGSRYATTVAMDVRSGGNVAFKVALANGGASPWENADSGEEVVVEYSTDGTNFTQFAGPYSSKTWQSVTVAIPTGARTASTRFRFLQLSNSGAEYDHWALEDVTIGSGIITAPEITVEQPVGIGLTDGSSTVNFGSVVTAGAQSLNFTIRNDGNASLTGVGISINGSNAGDYVVTSNPAATVAAGGTTTFVVRFSPGALGTRTAALHIASNDANENPFDINLTGTGFTPATTFFDDFDPNYDAALWSSFGGTVAANTNGQAAGIGSTGNSLWLGGDGSRFAATVPVDTRAGGSVVFKLAMANGGAAPWENADAGEEVVVEFSTDGTNYSQIGGPYNSTTWQTISVPLPLGAQTASTRFRFRQLSNSGADFDHWAIDDVQIGNIAAPEIVVEQPAGTNLIDGSSTASFGSVATGSSANLLFTIRNVGTASLTGLGITIDGTHSADFSLTASPVAPLAAGGSTTFTVRFSPSVTGSRNAAIHIASNDADENPFDLTLTGTGTAAGGGQEFRILTMQTTGAQVVDHDILTGDDRGGIAVSGSKVLVTGDNATSIHSVIDLTGGTSLGRVVDGLCSNIATGEVYTLAFNGTAHANGATSINQLIRLDPSSGAQTATTINLSQAIPVSASGCGVFSGYGRIVIHNGSSVYDIAVPSGTVSNLGAMNALPATYSENWASWGVAEYFGGQVYLAYQSSAGADIVRSRVPDGLTQTIASFTNISDLANFTVAPSLGRWYFHHEYSSQFGGTAETLGYATATFSVGSNVPPVITSALSASAATAAPFTYQISGTGSPTSYNATGLPVGLSVNTSTGLISGTVNSAGTYNISLSASNTYGTGTATLVLTVNNVVTAFFDDFDPNYDMALWSQFGGTVTANTNGQAAGSGSTGNSLWFGGDGSRYATTTMIDTRSGGSVVFKLAIASGATEPWEQADSGEEVVVEYTTDGTAYTQIGGPYNNTTWQTITLSIPAAAQTATTRFRFRQLGNSGASFDHWAIDDVQIGSGVGLTPEIAIEQPVGTSLADNSSTVAFGTVNTGSNSSLTFAIKNVGTAPLTGLSATISGSHAADFSLTTLPPSSLAAGTSATLVVRFTPSTTGARSALLQVASNDADENPFDIGLTGTGASSSTNVYTIDSTDRGWYDSAGAHTITNDNYLTGYNDTPGHYRSFFVFSLPTLGVGETITSAELRLYNPGGGNSGYISVDATESLEIREVTTGIAALTGGTGGTAAFADLADGTLFGGPRSVSSADNGTMITVPLNSAFLSWTAGRSGASIALGGSLSTLARSGSNEFVFGYSGSGAGQTQLVITTTSGAATPEIAVEQPVGSSLVDGSSTVDFGTTPLASSQQLSFTVRNTGSGALDISGVTINGTHASDFAVTTAPAASIAPGNSSTMVVRFSPSVAGARTAALHIASNDADESPFDINLTGTGSTGGAGSEFRILSLGTTGANVVDHNSLTGDDRAGIAVSGSNVFVTGDAATAAYSAADLTSGVSLGRLVDGLCSDISTGEVYTLAYNNAAYTNGGTTINQLIRLNPTTGAQTTTVVNLSQVVTVGSSCGVFSGYGRILIHNGSAVYDIVLPSGVVTNLGAMTIPSWNYSESWAVWGVAEYFGGQFHLAFRSGGGHQIVRARVPDGQLQTIASFSNISDLCNFTVAPTRGRWYFHHESSGQFGGSNETLGYADATFSIIAAGAPTITSATSANAVLGLPMSYQITATNSPTSYGATGLPSGLSINPSTGLISGTVSSAGVYNIGLSASNGLGTGTATLVLTASAVATTFFDDFDPSFDPSLWSGFNASVSANTNGQAAGAGSSGNSLWFGGDGTRSATTIAVDTRSAPMLAFSVVQALGSSAAWEAAESGEEVVVEYSTDGGATFTALADPFNNRVWERVTLPLPSAAQTPTTRFRFRQLSNSGASYDHWAIEDVQIAAGMPVVPDIAVETVTGDALRAGVSGLVFNSTEQGNTQTINLNVHNYGAANLTGLSVQIDGVNAGNFSATLSGGTTLAPGLLKSVDVVFAPTAAGGRTARLRIFSNDPDESPYELNLVGDGVASATGPVQILDSPAAVAAEIGQAFTLNVTAGGQPPLKYQWRRNGTNIAGATSSTLDVPFANTRNGGRYDCVVSNVDSGRTWKAYSNPAEVMVVDTSPRTLAVRSGSTASLAVTAAGNGLGYQWYLNGNPMPGAMGKSYRTPALSAGQSINYACEVTSLAGLRLTGAVTVVNVYTQVPGIMHNPGDALPQAMIGAYYEYQVPVDPLADRATSRFTASGLPSGLTINPTTGLISGVPRTSKPFPYTVTLKASNAIGTASVLVLLPCNPLPTGMVGRFQGPINRNAGLNGNLGGRFDILTSATGAYSGTLVLGASTYRFKGSLWTDVSAPQSGDGWAWISRSRLSALVLQFTLNSNSEQVESASLSDEYGVDTIAVGGWRIPWTNTNPAWPYFGYHTLAIEPTGSLGDSSVPQGAGYASFTVTSQTGSARLVGKLADGTPITIATYVGGMGQMVAFQKLYPSYAPGSLAGSLLLNGAPALQDQTLSGSLSWLRPARSSIKERTYRDGFGPLDVSIVGGGYVPPVAPAVLLAVDPRQAGNAALKFTGADGNPLQPSPSPDLALTISYSNRLLLPVAGTYDNQRRTSLAVSAAKGTLSGGFTMADPNPWYPPQLITRKATFSGLVVRDSSGVYSGRGFVLLPDLPEYYGQPLNTTRITSGRVTFEANSH